MSDGAMVGYQQGASKMTNRFDARRDQMLRELVSDLADLVESGDLTDMQANEWYNDKADQWSKEARMKKTIGCTADQCQRALEDYLSNRVFIEKLKAGPSLVCWETQDGTEPIRLSFSVKCF